MEENKEENLEKKKINLTEKIRNNPWILSTFVTGILIVILFITNFSGDITGRAVSANEAGEKLVAYLNTIAESEVKFVSVKDEGSVYKIIVEYQGENFPMYVTKDGLYYTSTLSPIITDFKETEQTQTQDIPKSDKPIVELFVMSFCPYGVRAENNIFSIIDLFKDKIDFRIRYIVNVNDDKIENVQSLHGINEAKEDARQLIINKYYPDKFYSYLKEINNNCYSIYNDATQLDACWKNAAKKLEIDINKIETAAYGKEGIDLLKLDEEISDSYGVSGSPTLIINGMKSNAIYSGTSATQQAICSAFNSIPSECQVELSDSSSSQSSGSC